MTRLLIDNQLPAALVRWLQGHGCQAEHVLELGLAQVSDELIWEKAALTGSVIVTKDEDFARMTLMRRESVTVLWLRIGNCRTPVLLAALEKAWPDVAQQLGAGARLVEVF